MRPVWITSPSERQKVKAPGAGLPLKTEEVVTYSMS